MSTFLRNNSNGGGKKRKLIGSRSHIINNDTDCIKKNTNKKKKKINLEDNESIASSDEEFAEENQRGKAEELNDESEREEETVQEKRLRLAKKYLNKIEEEEKDREEFEQGVIARRLQEEYLEEKGRLRKKVASNYSSHGNLIDLKCKDHKASITCICLSNNGKIVYSGSKDGTIVKWLLENKKKINVLKGKRKLKDGMKSVLCMAISSDGQFLVAGDGGCKDIKVFNGDDLKHLKNLQGHRGIITGLVFRRDTHTLYSASEDRSVKVWNLDDMAYVESLFGHQNSITSIDALSRERAITSGGFDRSVRIWKIIEESQLIFNGHESSVDEVKLINEENFLSCGDDGQLCVWDCLKKKPLCTVKLAHGIDKNNGQPMWISSIATLLNTDLVASGSRNGVVRLWQCGESFKTLTLLFEVQIDGFINALAFTSDGKNLIVGVGQEHKSGRWWQIPQAKNRLVVIPLLQNNSE